MCASRCRHAGLRQLLQGSECPSQSPERFDGASGDPSQDCGHVAGQVEFVAQQAGWHVSISVAAGNLDTVEPILNCR